MINRILGKHITKTDPSKFVMKEWDLSTHNMTSVRYTQKHSLKCSSLFCTLNRARIKISNLREIQRKLSIE